MKEVKVVLTLMCFTVLLLFLISPDSHIHALYNRVDSAFFFMCGKAWMNGMVPYIDFADSKGPLLWLIYGLGYLLSPQDYTGVFWISCIFYTAVNYIVYKIMMLYVPETRWAIVGTITMSLFFFSSWFHYEIRAEDFCQLFWVLSLYQSIRILTSYNCDHRKVFLIYGISLGCICMIKWSIAIMMLVFPLYVLLVQKHRVKNILWLILGFLISVLPFAIYFVSKGALSSLFYEYFLNTIRTVSSINPFVTFVRALAKVLVTPTLLVLFLFNIAGLAIYMKENAKLNYFPLLAFLYVFFLANYKSHTYYYTILASFAIFPVIVFLQKLNNNLRLRHIKVMQISQIVLVSAFVVFTNWFSQTGEIRPNLLSTNKRMNLDYNNITDIMKSIKKPKILSPYSYEYGLGLPANTLPGGKYWARQNGATDSMVQEAEESVIKGKADFVIMQNKFHNQRITPQLLDSLGYKKCYDCILQGYETSIYKRK